MRTSRSRTGTHLPARSRVPDTFIPIVNVMNAMSSSPGTRGSPIPRPHRARWLFWAMLGAVPVWAAEAPVAIYEVRPRETLTSIADQFLVDGATPQNITLLARLNRLANRHRIRPGQPLQLPVDRLKLAIRSATIVDHYGTARLDGRPVAKGDTATQGQEISTGADGGVRIALPDGSYVWVRETARMRIEALRNAPGLSWEDTRLEVGAGRVEAVVGKLRGRSRFEVRSPVARLGVRGTDFRAGYDASGRTTVLEVLEGAVGAGGTAPPAAGAASPATEVPVHAGMGLLVDAIRGVGKPKTLPPAPALSGLPTLFERPLVTFSVPARTEVAGLRAQIRDPQTRYLITTATVDGNALRFPDLPDGQYLLVVRARDGDGLEGGESTHAFRLAARPEPPFPASPRARQTERAESVQFAWSEALDGQRYRLQVAGAATFTTTAVDTLVTGTTQRIDTLPPGEWHWRLATIDVAGRQGPFGDAQRFTLRPMPGAPAEPAVEVGIARFAWPGEPGQKFALEISRTAGFANLERVVQTAQPEATITDLVPGVYYMRVRATDPDGYVGPYTAAQRFTMPEPPPPPPPPKGPVWPFLVPLLFLLF